MYVRVADLAPKVKTQKAGILRMLWSKGHTSDFELTNMFKTRREVSIILCVVFRVSLGKSHIFQIHFVR